MLVLRKMLVRGNRHLENVSSVVGRPDVFTLRIHIHDHLVLDPGDGHLV